MFSYDYIAFSLSDLFHWECLDSWARRLPTNTAPAGYKCQQCQEGIFPAPNQTSPIIERLQAVLQQANWARAGLGLSLVRTRLLCFLLALFYHIL